jgi:hypothetical protein
VSAARRAKAEPAREPRDPRTAAAHRPRARPHRSAAREAGAPRDRPRAGSPRAPRLRPAPRSVGAGLRSARIDPAHVDRAHLSREGRRREPPRGCEPERLVLGRGHAAEEPRLRPAEPPRGERRVDERQPRERCVHAREIVQLAPREPRPLAPVVRRPHEAERLPGPPRGERPRQPREHSSQRRPAARQLREPRIERLHRVGAHVGARLRRDRRDRRRHAGLRRDRGRERSELLSPV